MKEGRRIFGLPKNIIGMGLVSFLNDLSSDMVFPFIPTFLTVTLGASATFVGLVEGFADATASILKIIAGRLSDKYKARKPFVVFGYSLSAIAKPILAFATAPWHVFAVRFFDRVGKGTRDAPRDALISSSIEKKDVGRAFGFHRSSDTMGAALGPLLAFLILPLIDNDLRTLFLLSFVASFFAVLVIVIFVREIKPGEGLNVVSPESAAPISIPASRLRGQADEHIWKPSFIVFLIAVTLFTLGKASEAFLLMRASSVGVAVVFLPIIYFVFNISLAGFSTPVGILSDKIGHRNTYMIGMLLFSVTYALFGLASSALAVWALFALFGLSAAFTEGVGRAIVSDLVGEQHKATAFGIYNALIGLALLPSCLIFGKLWDVYGPSVPFYFGASLGLLSFVVFAFMRFGNGKKPA